MARLAHNLLRALCLAQSEIHYVTNNQQPTTNNQQPTTNKLTTNHQSPHPEGQESLR